MLSPQFVSLKTPVYIQVFFIVGWGPSCTLKNSGYRRSTKGTSGRKESMNYDVTTYPRAFSQHSLIREPNSVRGFQRESQVIRYGQDLNSTQVP